MFSSNPSLQIPSASINASHPFGSLFDHEKNGDYFSQNEPNSNPFVPGDYFFNSYKGTAPPYSPATPVTANTQDLIGQQQLHDQGSVLQYSDDYDDLLESIVYPTKKKPLICNKKDGHSKIYTAQGPRDRRVRLSIDIARKFFELQNLLGFDKASKTLDWLFTKSKVAIKELVEEIKQSSCSTVTTSQCELAFLDDDEDQKKSSLKFVDGKSKTKTQKNKSGFQVDVAREQSRTEARARARERTKEKQRIKKLQYELMKFPDECREVSSSNLEHQSWKLVLCKSVLGSLGNYLFSLYKAPEAIIKKLESIRRRFFWGEAGQNRKISWIGWKQVLNSYEKGGLNIGSLRALNLALLGKWWWRFYTEKEALWRISVTAIHGKNGNLGGRDRNGIWGTISKLQKYLNLGIVDFRSLFYEDDTGVGWGLEDDAVFSVSSLRRLLDEYALDCSGKVTHWFKTGPRKAKVLLWRVARDRLPTRDNLLYRGIFVPSNCCPLCNLQIETVKHIFFDCNFSMTVRSMIKSWYQDFCDSEADVDGIARRVKAHKGISKSIAEIVHLAYFWVLWGYMNDLVHLSSTKCAVEILVVIKNVSLNWVRGKVTTCRNITWDRWTCCPKLACNIVSC